MYSLADNYSAPDKSLALQAPRAERAHVCDCRVPSTGLRRWTLLWPALCVKLTPTMSALRGSSRGGRLRHAGVLCRQVWSLLRPQAELHLPCVELHVHVVELQLHGVDPRSFAAVLGTGHRPRPRALTLVFELGQTRQRLHTHRPQPCGHSRAHSSQHRRTVRRLAAGSGPGAGQGLEFRDFQHSAFLHLLLGGGCSRFADFATSAGPAPAPAPAPAVAPASTWPAVEEMPSSGCTMPAAVSYSSTVGKKARDSAKSSGGAGKQTFLFAVGHE